MLASLALAVSLAVPRDPWFGADKLKHFFIAAFVQSASYGVTRLTRADHSVSLGVAVGTTALVSVGKELVDRRRQRLFSVRDLLWDAAGAGASTAIISRSRRP